MKESVFMAEWILGADLLNKSALCKKTEIDPSNFNKFLAKGEVPKQHLEKIKAEIIKFGYVPPAELAMPEIHGLLEAADKHHSPHVEPLSPLPLLWEQIDALMGRKEKQSNVPPKEKEAPVAPENNVHELWKEGDPKENSGAFFIKYNCMNYQELSELKK